MLFRSRGAGIDEERVPQLTDVTQPLDGGGVDHGQRFGIEPDVVPERVADDLEPGHDVCLGAAGDPKMVVPRGRSREFTRDSSERSTILSPWPCVPDRGVHLILELGEVVPEHLREPRGLRIVGRRVAPRAARQEQALRHAWDLQRDLDRKSVV